MSPLDARSASRTDIVRRTLGRSAPLLVALLAACDAASAPGSRPPLSLSFAARPAPTEVTGAVAALGTPQTFELRATEGDDELVVTSVELVFDEIELERAGLGDGCGGDDWDDDSSSGSSSGSPGDDDCMEIETGPELVVLPLGDGAPLPAIAVHVPAGTYSELEMKLRPLNPGSGEDRRFLAANPGFDGINLRVRGTFDGSAFEYTASLDNEIELYFRPALEVGEGGVNITINLDVMSWFRGPDGALLDPRTAIAGEPNASVVAANIWRSLAVYEDDDHDGYDDHGGHGGRDGDD